MSRTQPSTNGLHQKVGTTLLAAHPHEPPFLNKDCQQITLEGEVWNVVGTGVAHENRIYCHLSSVDKFLLPGRPIQKCVWVRTELINKANQ